MDQGGKKGEFDAKVLVALGSNATSHHGDPAATVNAALRRLNGEGLRVSAQSRLYLTPFIPVGGGPDVVNAVAVVETGLSPEALLAALHRIEAAFDRDRRQRWGARTLDLDLLLVDDLVLPDRATFEAWRTAPPERQRAEAPDGLVLPHPRLAERAFVLVPAAEVAPHWRHPVLGHTLAELLAALPEDEVAAVRMLGEDRF